MLLQEAAVCQESYASVIAEEEWSNVGFNVIKADEVHRGEKGEEEVRGEKESREVKRTRGGPPKVSHTEACLCVHVWYCTSLLVLYSSVSPPTSPHYRVQRTLVRQSLTRQEEEGSGLTMPAHKYNLRRRTLGATPSH